MNVINHVAVLWYTRNDQGTRHQAERIQFLCTAINRNIFPVQVGRNFGGRRCLGDRLLGAYLIQQPTENQSYKQPFGQRKRFFLKRESGHLLYQRSSSASKPF